MSGQSRYHHNWAPPLSDPSTGYHGLVSPGSMYNANIARDAAGCNECVNAWNHYMRFPDDPNNLQNIQNNCVVNCSNINTQLLACNTTIFRQNGYFHNNKGCN